MFEETLHKFLALCETDAALRAFAAQRRLSVHYVISDRDLDFHMVFADGAVQAGLGPPPGRPDLTLTGSTSTFEGIMTGTVNAFAAAMLGKLKYAGDTARATALQRVSDDLVRLYTAAQDPA